MRIFDSHAHYDDPRFEAEFEGGRERALSFVFSSGVERIVNIGANLTTSEHSVALAAQYERIYATVGIHPNDCGKSGTLEQELDRIRALAASPKVVAIGEIGMDFHYDQPSEQIQRAWFCAQMELAEQLGLPVVVHDREAHGICMEIVRAYAGRVRGVFHSYSGSLEMAKELINLGWIVSFSGVVTFKNARRVAEVVQGIPIEDMMVETDCPYLAPHPLRGTLNHSANLTYTVAEIARLKGLTPDEVAEQTYQNACRFYRLPCEGAQ